MSGDGEGNGARSHSPRRAILDLAPLELDCMNALWPLGEATVRDIQQSLVPARPRAYTTIMTIMDRLAQKGIVARRKSGKAYVYRPNLSAEEARAHAVEQVVAGFFSGSPGALAAHLSGGATLPERRIEQRPRPASPSARKEIPPRAEEPPREAPLVQTPRLDETLL